MSNRNFNRLNLFLNSGSDITGSQHVDSRGSVVTWGNAEFGGDSTDSVQDQLRHR